MQRREPPAGSSGPTGFWAHVMPPGPKTDKIFSIPADLSDGTRPAAVEREVQSRQPKVDAAISRQDPGTRSTSSPGEHRTRTSEQLDPLQPAAVGLAVNAHVRHLVDKNDIGFDSKPRFDVSLKAGDVKSHPPGADALVEELRLVWDQPDPQRVPWTRVCPGLSQTPAAITRSGCSFSCSSGIYELHPPAGPQMHVGTFLLCWRPQISNYLHNRFFIFFLSSFFSL